jgi:glyceraldehyde-3-phosphate dehydrogenase (NADP+)
MRTQPLCPVSFPSIEEIPEEFRPGDALQQQEFLVGGELHRWEGPAQPVASPVCLRTDGGLSPAALGSYPLLTDHAAMGALDAALEAWDDGRGAWPTMTVEQRIEHVEEFVRRMRAKRDEVVRLLMWEIGKPHRAALKEFDRTVDYIQDSIDVLKGLDRDSSRFVITEGILGQIRRAPLGVALCMGPFNYPLNETFTTLIPALLMGNVVVFKPPKLGVLLHRPLLEAFRDAFPPGVVNTVYGEGQVVIGPMLQSGRVDVLAFIGSSRVADVLKRQHPAPHRLRCVLGLEAKNPAIVLPDADLDLAVRECVLGALSYNGQRCTALKILFVHSSVVDRFLDGFCTAVNNQRRGMPWEEGVAITPLAEPGKTKWLAELVEDAERHGARVINAEGCAVEGTFFHPAVVYPVAPQARLYSVEQFGPVVPVVPFDDVDEPVRYAVESEYGQQASIFGNDPSQLARIIDPLVNQVCRVNLNSQCQRGPDSFPFSGRKASAEGTLSVSDALKVFAIRTLVAAKDTDANRDVIRAIVRDHHSKFLSTDFIF